MGRQPQQARMARRLPHNTDYSAIHIFIIVHENCISKENVIIKEYLNFEYQRGVKCGCMLTPRFLDSRRMLGWWQSSVLQP